MYYPIIQWDEARFLLELFLDASEFPNTVVPFPQAGLLPRVSLVTGGRRLDTAPPIK